MTLYYWYALGLSKHSHFVYAIPDINSIKIIIQIKKYYLMN